MPTASGLILVQGEQQPVFPAEDILPRIVSFSTAQCVALTIRVPGSAFAHRCKRMRFAHQSEAPGRHDRGVSGQSDGHRDVHVRDSVMGPRTSDGFSRRESRSRGRSPGLTDLSRMMQVNTANSEIPRSTLIELPCHWEYGSSGVRCTRRSRLEREERLNPGRGDIFRTSKRGPARCGFRVVCSGLRDVRSEQAGGRMWRSSGRVRPPAFPSAWKSCWHSCGWAELASARALASREQRTRASSRRVT